MLLGGAAVLGGVAYWYFTKPRKNRDGFYSADGGGSTSTLCMKQNADGSWTSYTPHGGKKPCPAGGTVQVIKSIR